MKVIRLTPEESARAKALDATEIEVREAVKEAEANCERIWKSRREFLTELQAKYLLNLKDAAFAYVFDETCNYLMGWGPGPEASEEERQKFLANLASLKAKA